ncbi:hypothetical protein [Streptomyces sp. NPDC093544]|jgi:hypothetical protein|uniref:hypothetical protein n=1 Tax=Streptomyces sp. NPDC093544 TaxID=3155200 RepID=UPI0034448D30
MVRSGRRGGLDGVGDLRAQLGELPGLVQFVGVEVVVSSTRAASKGRRNISG